MTRFSTTAINSYLTEPVLDFRLLADVQVASETLLMHTGVGTLTVGGSNYLGIGWLGGVEKVQESIEEFTPGVRLYLTAVESVPLMAAYSESLFGKSVTLRRCWLRDNAIVGTPEVWYIGQIGEVNVHRGDPERGNYIEINCETKLNRSSKSSYYTKDDMIVAGYSGDTFFNYLSQIATVKALWGQTQTFFSVAPSGGSVGQTIRDTRQPGPGSQR